MLTSIIYNIFSILDYNNKTKFIFLIIYTFLVNCFEVLTIYLLFPYLSLLLNSELPSGSIGTSIQFVLNYIGKDTLYYFSLMYAALIGITFFLRLFFLYITNTYSYSIGTFFLEKILLNITTFPFIRISKLKSDDLLSIFSVKIDLLIRGVFQPIITLFSTLIMVTFILLALLFINFKVSSILFFGLLVFYLLTSIFVRTMKVKNSILISTNTNMIIRLVNEMFSNIKYVLVSNIANFYTREINKCSSALFGAYAKNNFIGMFPKVTIESIVLISIVLTSFFYVTSFENIKTDLPYIAVLAFSAQKLIPQMQTIYYSISSIYGNYKSSIELFDYLNINTNKYPKNSKKLLFKNQIKFHNVSFAYPLSNFILKNINFTIKKNQIIGIKGKSGSGKTTLSDILLGLLTPINGYISVDGIKITKRNLTQWRNKFSIVPQDVFLINGTISENIALGIDINDVNHGKVFESSVKADISEYINKLPKKYNYNINDKGSKLSGGQKQRLAIARSLYLEKEIFIFDEATSALDIETEKKVIKSIISLNKTIIIISHKSEILDMCNKIIDLGKLNV